jgi:hypothetical protein
MIFPAFALPDFTAAMLVSNPLENLNILNFYCVNLHHNILNIDINLYIYIYIYIYVCIYIYICINNLLYVEHFI